MVSVTADQVRKRLGLTSADVSDADVLAFVDEATAFLSDEIGRTLDYTNCTEGEANAIRNLAAIYSFCYVSGGVAVGLNFSVGDLNVSESSAKQVAFLKEQVERFIKRERAFAPVLGEYEGS
jgi:hypothetical protein